MDRIGRYKIVRELGRGAMGVVYHAIDPNIGRPVAIKTINLGAVPKAEDQERMRERLFREALAHAFLIFGLGDSAQIDGLDGDRTADIGIDGVVDHAHGAAAKLPYDFVPSDTV